MRACVITQHGGPEVLQITERSVPVLQPGEVLLRVQAAGVNGADLLQRKGKYPVPPGVSAEIPGLEAAGEIVAVAKNVKQWKIGDKVAALLTGGGYAEQALKYLSAEREPPGAASGDDWRDHSELSIIVNDLSEAPLRYRVTRIGSYPYAPRYTDEADPELEFDYAVYRCELIL